MVIVTKSFSFTWNRGCYFLMVLLLNFSLLKAQIKNNNLVKQYEFSTLSSIPSFMNTFKNKISPFVTDIDSSPLPIGFNITGIVSDEYSDFRICSIPVFKIFVYNKNSESIIYLLIENLETNINKIKAEFQNLPYCIISSGQDDVEDFVSAYCFEKKNYDVWVHTGISIFTGKNKNEHILISLQKDGHSTDSAFLGK